MKCIAYISSVAYSTGESGVPSDFSSIHQHARKANLAIGISSVFSYKNGYYLQVIEGPSKRVDELFDKITTDKRHKNVTPILNTFIDARSFPKNSMRLIASLQKSNSFRRFIHKYLFEISQIDASKKRLFESIFDQPECLINHSNLAYKDKVISLTAWPDFTQLPLKPSLTELCARLAGSTQNYNNLLEEREPWSQLELNGTLDKLSALGILDIQGQMRIPPETPSSERGVASFYHKLRSMLGVAV